MTLKEYLASRRPGPLDNGTQISILLAEIWKDLDGTSAEATTENKLTNRPFENLRWDPPILHFEIERHGMTANGSTRAEIHKWEVDLEAMSARITGRAFRQLYAREKRVNVKEVAERIKTLIESKSDHECLDWKVDGSVVVRVGKIEELCPTAAGAFVPPLSRC